MTKRRALELWVKKVVAIRMQEYDIVERRNLAILRCMVVKFIF